jgi:acetyl esterase/lipase
MKPILALFTLILPALAFAQGTEDVPRPTHTDIAYDDIDPAQVLDAYLAAKPNQPVLVYIHGGGWRAGTKTSLPDLILKVIEDGWANVISVEYRFTDVAPHPAQANDCTRAIQFIRSKAEEWKLDTDRLGITGGSAGAHLSLWVTLHDDASDPGSEDAVERHSSRASCAVSFAGPTAWSLLSEIRHGHPAYCQLLGYEPRTPPAEMDEKKVADVSPVTFATEDDPPILLIHGDADATVPLAHAETLHTRLKEVGATSELLVVPEGTHGVARGYGKSVNSNEHAEAFLKKHLAR